MFLKKEKEKTEEKIKEIPSTMVSNKNPLGAQLNQSHYILFTRRSRDALYLDERHPVVHALGRSCKTTMAGLLLASRITYCVKKPNVPASARGEDGLLLAATPSSRKITAGVSDWAPDQWSHQEEEPEKRQRACHGKWHPEVKRR